MECGSSVLWLAAKGGYADIVAFLLQVRGEGEGGGEAGVRRRGAGGAGRGGQDELSFTLGSSAPPLLKAAPSPP